MSYSIFSTAALTCEFLEYEALAFQAHQGADGAGHYRTALRARVGDHEKCWLLCDDWSRPERLQTLPGWFCRSITLAWYVRADLLNLFLMPPETDTTQILLQVLQDHSAHVYSA